MKKIFLITFLAILLVSCTKKDTGFKTYFNNSTPANPNFDIEIVESFELNNEGSEQILNFPADVTEDKDRNIFILSVRNKKVIKYDKEGKYIIEFGGLGDGPGELQQPASIVCLEDTIYVADFTTKKINLYNVEGEFIRANNSSQFSRSNSLTGKQDMFVSQNLEYIDDKDGFRVKSNLTLLNKKFNEVATISNLNETGNPFIVNTRIHYALTSKFLYVAEKSKDFYRVNMFDHRGSKIGIISKNYSRIPFEDKENRFVKSINSKHKEAISNLFVDYKDNLWVDKTQRDSLVDGENILKFKVDVFSEGVFQNSVNLGLEYDPFNLFILNKVIKDKIYTMHTTDNKVIVSRYVIKEN
ncbi:MAG: 6-bladed beta-propeller [Candidatus Delongbacteria bacterium]|jgi:hypothetical protein|nr:6-bladed beta-propeller [Candidatus Delongbacteria bacterium]